MTTLQTLSFKNTSNNNPNKRNRNQHQINTNDSNINSLNQNNHKRTNTVQSQQIQPKTELQRHLINLLHNIKNQLLQSNIIQNEEQLSTKSILNLPQQLLQEDNYSQGQLDDSFYVENFSSVVNYLIASVMAEREQNNLLMESIQKKNQNNDQKVLQGIQIFVDLTQKMADFSKDIYKSSTSQRQLPVFVYKHFRKVYQTTEQLSNIFNQYQLNNQNFLSKRDELIALQIKCMQQVFLDQEEQQLQKYYNKQSAFNPNGYNLAHQQTMQDQQEYILSLRQQIANLHQTLRTNDQQFTLQIQNYNRTLREMSSTIKAYEIQLSKITLQQMKISQLEALIVRLRQQKYRNQIVIDNMAKKIRNYQKQIKGDKAFLSPQRMVKSPQKKVSLINSKVSSVISINNQIRPNSSNLSNGLLSPKRKSFF